LTSLFNSKVSLTEHNKTNLKFVKSSQRSLQAMTIVAIDLGTANTRIAVWHNGTVKVLRNDKGNRTTPSFVAFTAVERLIGDTAKNQVELLL
jgi:molecular chaperone DnaK (HSP70)